MYRTWSSNRSVCRAILRFGRHLWPAGTFCLDLMCSVFLARELWHSFKDETLARVSVKFEFRYPGLTSKISFILCNYCFMIEWPKKKWQSHLELFFWTKEKETRVKNILGLITVIGLQTTQVCLSFFSRFLTNNRICRCYNVNVFYTLYLFLSIRARSLRWPTSATAKLTFPRQNLLLCLSSTLAIFKIRNGESGNGNGERGIFKMENL